MTLRPLLLATAANSALRDAQIGLGILWIAMLALRRALPASRPGGMASARCLPE